MATQVASAVRIPSVGRRMALSIRDRAPVLACSSMTIAGALLGVSVLFGESAWSWLLLIAAGAAGGAVAGRPRDVWLVWLAVAVEYPLAAALGAVSLTEPLWIVDLLAAAALASGGFVAGTTIGWRGDRVAAAGADWWAQPQRRRQLVVGALLALPLALIGYGATVGLIGVATWTSDKSADCRTPAYWFGWSYEAVNYDQAADATLVPGFARNASGTWTWTCSGTRAPARDEVVTEDNVAIAGWYIPAASAIGAQGPTIVIVPGGKSNKSEMLKYAEPFHRDYNLVILDDRGMGQSGDGKFAMGALEQWDVRAMVDWLERTKHPAWIAALGNSMGAATALAEAVDDERIRALVIDSMHARAVIAVGNILEGENHLPAVPASWAIVGMTALDARTDVSSADPIVNIARLGSRPVLLIHGTADALDRPEQSAELNLRAALAAGVHAELNYCPGGTHGRLVDDENCARHWARWATAFLAAAQAVSP